MAGTQPNSDSLEWGILRKLLSSAARVAAEQAPVIARFGHYGETVAELITGKQHKLADEGSYFLTRSPTPGTGLATIAAPTTFAATSPFLIVTNNNPVGGKNIFLDYLKLICTAAGTGGTALNFATVLDAGSRYTSGGSGGAGTQLASLLAGPYTPNMQAAGQSGALVYAGALVAAAATAGARTLSNSRFRTAIPVVNDEYVINFGGDSVALDGVLVSGTAIAQRTVPHAPVVIAPGSSFLLHLWLPSQSAASSYEVDIGHVER